MEIALVIVAFLFCVTAFTCVAIYSDTWLKIEERRSQAMLKRAREDRGE